MSIHPRTKNSRGRDIVNKLNIFGKDETFEFTSKDQKIESYLGFMTTLATGLILLALVYREFFDTLNNNQNMFATNIYGYELNEKGIINLSEQKLPMNFVFSMYHEDDFSIQIEDNPYITLKYIEYSSEYDLTERKDVQFQKCTKEQLKQMFTKSELEIFEQSICLNQDSGIRFLNNYLDYDEFVVPYFVVSECQNSTENGNKCASKEEIEAFVRNTQFMLTVSIFQAFENIYEDNAEIFTDKNEYYPIKMYSHQVYWGALEDYRREQKFLKLNTLFASLDVITVNDNRLSDIFTSFYERSTEFFNFNNFLGNQAVLKNWYAVDDEHPLLAFEIIMEHKGRHIQRKAHTFLQVAASLGGLSRVVIPIMTVLHSFFSFYRVQAIKIHHLSFDLKDLIKSREFLTPSFQLKIFLRKKLKFLFKFNPKFLDLEREFDERYKVVSKYLQVSSLIQSRNLNLAMQHHLFTLLYKMMGKIGVEREELKTFKETLDLYEKQEDDDYYRQYLMDQVTSKLGDQIRKNITSLSSAKSIQMGVINHDSDTKIKSSYFYSKPSECINCARGIQCKEHPLVKKRELVRKEQFESFSEYEELDKSTANLT